MEPTTIGAGAVIAYLLLSGDSFELARWTITETGLPNKPDATALANLKMLARHMEKIYNDAKEVGAISGDLRITSAYRSSAVNTAVGGSRTSEHLWGLACDFFVPSPNIFYLKMRQLLTSSVYGRIHQVIVYPNSTHVHIGWYGNDDTRTARQFLKYVDGVYTNLS